MNRPEIGSAAAGERIIRSKEPRGAMGKRMIRSAKGRRPCPERIIRSSEAGLLDLAAVDPLSEEVEGLG
ncbi:hypothetical protein D3C83_126970 [compost metagenome]